VTPTGYNSLIWLNKRQIQWQIWGRQKGFLKIIFFKLFWSCHPLFLIMDAWSFISNFFSLFSKFLDLFLTFSGFIFNLYFICVSSWQCISLLPSFSMYFFLYVRLTVCLSASVCLSLSFLSLTLFLSLSLSLTLSIFLSVSL
jgi:hypothetical protein